MGLDDMFSDFIRECKDYIKEREYKEEIVEKAEVIFDLMICYNIEAWNVIEFPENIKEFRKIHKISLKMKIDMKEKLLLQHENQIPNKEFMNTLNEDKEKLKQLLTN